ncbi:MAG: hypothetical protein ACKO6N_25995 [Myxococcota bacterium]
MELAFISDVIEDFIEIVDEQKELLLLLECPSFQGLKCGVRKLLSVVTMALLEALGKGRWVFLLTGGGQGPQHFKPEVGQIADPITLLQKHHGAPATGQLLVVFDQVFQSQKKRCFPHASWPKEEPMLMAGGGGG